MTHLNTLFATWFYLGFIKKAPGTWGSLGGLIFIYLLSYGNRYMSGHYIAPLPYITLTAALFILGIISARVFDRDHNTHDSKMIVIDEVVGMMITCAPMIMLSAHFNAPLAFGGISQPLIAFALFRFFDIIKPWPICLIDQKVKGGLGVMLDDVVAGLFAAIIFTLIGMLVHVFI